jgi:RNA polymerase sigma-70 factor (ECF subfamily)
MESNAELIRRVLSGERNAHALMMGRYNQRLYRVAWAITRDSAEAEDVVQESWLLAFRKLSQVEDAERVGAWLTRLTANMALGRRRASDRSELVAEAELELGPEPAAQGDPEALAARREFQPVLEAAVASLPDVLRSAFILREVEGMPVADVAETLGVPEATVKTRAFRARELLRRRLGEWGDGELGQFAIFAGERCSGLAARVLARLFGPDSSAESVS